MDKTNIILTAAATTIGTLIVRAVAGGFAVMLLLGVVWGEFGLLKPLGYLSSVWFVLAITLVIAAFQVNASFTVSQESTTTYK